MGKRQWTPVAGRDYMEGFLVTYYGEHLPITSFSVEFPLEDAAGVTIKVLATREMLEAMAKVK